MGTSISYTRNAASLQEKALAICMVKSKYSYFSLFLLGVVCNIFILSKSEHCVADMFYISMANYWNINISIRLLVIVFGNAVGGIVAHTLLTKTKGN